MYKLESLGRRATANRRDRHTASQQRGTATPKRGQAVRMMIMLTTLVFFGATTVATAATAADSRPWMNKADPPSVRAKKLVAEMKMEEKLVMLHGPIAPMPCCECFNKTTGKIVDKACAYTGNVVPNTRLGIPPIHMNGAQRQPLRCVRRRPDPAPCLRRWPPRLP